MVICYWFDLLALVFCFEVQYQCIRFAPTPLQLPEVGAIFEGILHRIVGSTLQRRASADEKIRLAARLVAEFMRAVNIRVTSSFDIGGFFP